MRSASYYDELDQPHAEAWVRVGWRQRLEQVYRFELALECLAATQGSVVDIGCGLGDLARYAAACGSARRFVGIEPRESFAAQARAVHEVVAARFEEVAPPEAGCAVALGTLAGGGGTKLADLVRFAAAAAPTFCVVVLDASRLGERVLLAAEHAGAAATSGELIAAADGLAHDARVLRISSTDLALVASTESLPALRTIEARYQAAIDGPWGMGESAAKKAWLACELELVTQARAWIANGDAEDPLADVVAARVRRLPPAAGSR